MVKNIILHLDDELFYRMKEDKIRREKILGAMTWELYIAKLFGFALDN